MKKKRHHYIPQFYLNNFVDQNNIPYIWVYDKEVGSIIKASAKDIAVEKHYFSFITPERIRDSETIENALSYAEGFSSEVIRKIINGSLLNKEDKKTFVIFLALMHTRVPNKKHSISDAIGQLIKVLYMKYAKHDMAFDEIVRHIEEITHRELPMPAEELRKWALNGQYEMKVDSQYCLSISMSTIKTIADVLYNMRWTFIRATSDYKFLTGDNPLFYIDPTHDIGSPYGYGLLNENIEVSFPISHNLCAVGTWKGTDGYIQGSNSLIKLLNGRTIIASLRFVFSSIKSDKIRDLAIKYKGSSPKIEVSYRI